MLISMAKLVACGQVFLASVFSRPLDIPTTATGLLWALPISLSIALVYKAIKLPEFRGPMFAREVALLFGTIVGFLVVVGVVLAGIAYLITL